MILAWILMFEACTGNVCTWVYDNTAPTEFVSSIVCNKYGTIRLQQTDMYARYRCESK